MPANMAAGRVSHSSVARVSASTSERLKRHRVKAGDVLFSRRGEIGRFAVITDTEQGWLCGTGCLRVRFPDSIRPTYAAMIFESHESQKWLQRNAVGQTMLNLSASILANLPFIVRDTAEQDRWAMCYDSLSQLKRLLEKEIAAKREFKRGLMQLLLTGRKRFPGFTSKWLTVHLGDVFTERNEINRQDLQLLSVTGGRGIISRDKLDKRDTSNPDKGKYKRVAVGDIAYNTMRMWQGVSALSSLEGIVSPAYTVVVPTERIDGRFAKHLFKFPPVVHLFHRHSQGLVDDTLNLKFTRFAKIKLTIPADTGEQCRIADVLDLCDAEIELLTAQLDKTEDYKHGLLSKLLSADIPVPA